MTKGAVSPIRNSVKPAKRKAERVRLANARAWNKFREIGREIPDNAVLANILLQLKDRPIREGFYRNVAPHLKFKPISLETIQSSEMAFKCN